MTVGYFFVLAFIDPLSYRTMILRTIEHGCKSIRPKDKTPIAIPILMLFCPLLHGTVDAAVQ